MFNPSVFHTHRRSSVAASIAVALAGLCGTAQADSTSSASSASSTSVGSSSVSIQNSSDSSSRKDRVAQGDYTVVDIAQTPGRPGMLRVRLQAWGQQPAEHDAAHTRDAFFLILPEGTARGADLHAGTRVTALHRPYGVAFLVRVERGPDTSAGVANDLA